MISKAENVRFVDGWTERQSERHVQVIKTVIH